MQKGMVQYFLVAGAVLDCPISSTGRGADDTNGKKEQSNIYYWEMYMNKAIFTTIYKKGLSNI